ncbi:Transposable element Tcb2 transposase, partial [Stegodyphus mimosarum]
MTVRQARTVPTVSYSTIQLITATFIPSVVPSTISRRLSEAVLLSHRPFRRLPLTPQHRLSPLYWCRSQSSWLPSDWHRMVFSDESRFTLEADDHRVRVWRGQSQRSQLVFVLQRHTTITPGVMEWSAISYDSRSSLVILPTSLTAERYVDTILRPIALPFMARNPAPFSNKIMPSHIPLAYLWTVSVRLILFLGQQVHQTFHQSRISETW